MVFYFYNNFFNSFNFFLFFRQNNYFFNIYRICFRFSNFINNFFSYKFTCFFQLLYGLLFGKEILKHLLLFLWQHLMIIFHICQMHYPYPLFPCSCFKNNASFLFINEQCQINFLFYFEWSTILVSKCYYNFVIFSIICFQKH